MNHAAICARDKVSDLDVRPSSSCPQDWGTEGRNVRRLNGPEAIGIRARPFVRRAHLSREPLLYLHVVGLAGLKRGKDLLYQLAGRLSANLNGDTRPGARGFVDEVD